MSNLSNLKECMVAMCTFRLTSLTKVIVIALRAFVADTSNRHGLTAVTSVTFMNFSVALAHLLFELFITNCSYFCLDLFVNFTKILKTELASLLAPLAWLTFFVEFGTLTVKANSVLLNTLFFLFLNSVDLDNFLVDSG